MAQGGFAFCHRFRVRWSETDAQGVVFNARYLDYADLGLTEYWRHVDFRNSSGAGPMDFHVAHAEVAFRKPIKPDEVIDIWCRVHGNQREQITEMGDDAFSALLGRHRVKLGVSTRYPLGPTGLGEEMKWMKTFGGGIVVTGSGGPKGLPVAELKAAMQGFFERMKPHVAAAEASPRGAWVDTDDLNDGKNKRGREIKNDLHYSIKGYETFGKRLAEKSIELVNKKTK